MTAKQMRQTGDKENGKETPPKKTKNDKRMPKQNDKHMAAPKHVTRDNDNRMNRKCQNDYLARYSTAFAARILTSFSLAHRMAGTLAMLHAVDMCRLSWPLAPLRSCAKSWGITFLERQCSDLQEAATAAIVALRCLWLTLTSHAATRLPSAASCGMARNASAFRQSYESRATGSLSGD